MDVDPQETFATLQTGLGQLYALAVSYSLSVVGAVLLLILGFFAARLVQRSTSIGLGRFPGFDQTLRQFFANIAYYAVLALVAVMVLGQFGVQTASIIAAIGAIGLAIGLALQGTLQNIAAGIMLLALRPFRVGEFVEVGGVSGTVNEIGLFATQLTTVDGLFILAPNSTLWNQPVSNFTRNGVRRNDITIGIGYGDSIELAQTTLAEIAESDSRVSNDPAPQTFVAALGDSSVSVTLRYWTKASDYLSTRFDLVERCKLAFDDRGISIPFPQQEVTYKNAPAPSQ